MNVAGTHENGIDLKIVDERNNDRNKTLLFVWNTTDDAQK